MAVDEMRLKRLTYQRKQADRWRLDELVKLADREIGNLMIDQADEDAASKAAPVGRKAPQQVTAAPTAPRSKAK